jgi:hypothetical protein
MFQEVAVPGRGEEPTPEVLLAEITDWVRSAPLQSLISHFGGALPAGSPAGQLRFLDGLPRRDYEWEVMEDGLRRAFGLPEFTVKRESGPSAEASQRFRVASAAVDGQRVSLIVAPAFDPGRRANTADGYRYWPDQVQHVKRGERILAVTTCIYVPYQHAIALRHLALPFGCSVDTVGIDFSSIGDDPNPQRFRGAHYLLEIRSALLAYRQLVIMLAGSGADRG